MIQKPMFSPQTEWVPPDSFPDLSKYDEIAIDLETKDPYVEVEVGDQKFERKEINSIS